MVLITVNTIENTDETNIKFYIVHYVIAISKLGKFIFNKITEWDTELKGTSLLFLQKNGK